MKKVVFKSTEIIDIRRHSFDDWLLVFLSTDETTLYPSMCFPSEEVRDEYLKRVESSSDKEVKNILRKFLIKTSRIEADNWKFSYM